MLLKITALVSILTTAFAGGLFWSPWLAFTISLRHLPPDVFLALTARLSRIMTFVLPFSLLTMLPVLWLAYAHQPVIFYCTLAELFLLALVVTVRVEVTLVQQMERWTVATLPTGWEQVRDRWGSFHRLRVGAAILGLGLLVAGALFGYEVV